MSDEIQQNRYDRLVRRVTAIVGPGSKVAQVITELFPMIDVENVPSELLVLGGTATCFRGTDIIAAAGDENASQLANPENSNTIITVTGIHFSINSNDRVNITLGQPLIANSNGFGQFRDSRAGPGPAVGNTRIETGLAIAANTTFQMESSVTLSLGDANDIAVLLPGDQITVSTINVAKRLIVTYFWRERTAEASELSL